MKRLMYGFLLLGAWASGQLHAYSFEFSNHTNQELWIFLKLDGDPYWKVYDWVLQPKSAGREKSTHTFYFGPLWPNRIVDAEWWKAGFCLKDLKISTPLMEEKRTIDEEGNEKITYIRKLDSAGKPDWNPDRNLIVLHIKDEAYNAMVQAGSILADTVTEAAAIAATAATGVPVPSFKVSGIVQAAGTLAAYGKCKDVHFDLIPTADPVSFGERTMFNIVAMTIAK